MKKENKDVIRRLLRLAWAQSRPYCRKCHRVTELEYCEVCRSYKLMRENPGIGIGPDINWVLKELLVEHSDFEISVMFDEILDETREQIRVGDAVVTPSKILRMGFPKSHQMLVKEFESKMFKEGRIIRIASELYWTDDVIDWLEKNEPASLILH